MVDPCSREGPLDRRLDERPWVVKRCDAGLSQGVALLSGRELLAASERWASGREAKSPWTVAQEYLERPYMGFGGSKFHLRVYVLVTRWAPSPSVLVFDEGLVFRSRDPYQHDNLSEGRDIHPAPPRNNVEAFSHATLWASLDAKSAARQAKAAIVQRPGSAEVRGRMAAAIRAIFGEALAESFGDPGETDPSRVGFACFDLFGLDVMFDEELRPFVLEVNHGPNLQVDDRGEESEGLLGRVKAPLVAQLAAWAALRARRALEGAAGERRTEDEALLSFTRVL
ncbi:unnamed protein product [Prorocentrum cordatum]|uniref:Tubulin--tyrosine ligase-like protein 9 n=1 Tax=Prorocentrum cordatum TaxID=2364126 RepID=A0ABN9V4Y1_9DINO|nr:unnamed protein product [Polarella glacialis]